MGQGRSVLTEDACLRTYQAVDEPYPLGAAIYAQVRVGFLEQARLSIYGYNALPGGCCQHSKDADVAAKVHHHVGRADIESSSPCVYTPAVDFPSKVEVLAGQADLDALKAELARTSSQ
jgi:hypothetical protein